MSTFLFFPRVQWLGNADHPNQYQAQHWISNDRVINHNNNMSNSWPSVHVNQQPVTRKCHCHTLIHTSMRSPWQQVSSQHMGVYCFGSCTSPSCLCVLHSMWRCVCVSHSACPHVILEYINYTSLCKLTVP